MKKTQLLNQFGGDPAQRTLLARILDKRSLTEARDLPTSSGFLSAEEQGLTEALLHRLPPLSFLLFGGYEEAERKICAFLPSWMSEARFLTEEEGPLCAVEVTVPPLASLTHRDYLGSLMGLGLTREKIGDILLVESGCQVLVLREVLPILLDQWATAGRYPVTLRTIALSELTVQPPEAKRLRDTVASLRLDAVLAAGLSLSRGRAADLIGAGRVLVNHRPCEKADKLVAEGDVLSCRGLGKCVLRQVGGTSKKGRTMIEMDRYG